MKLNFDRQNMVAAESPPARGRGLKRLYPGVWQNGKTSPPARGRGLKLNNAGVASDPRSRPPRGGVD